MPASSRSAAISIARRRRPAPPVLGRAGDPGFGTIQQGYLENSNVDPVKEITELISAQRAYEMNSKVIQAADDMFGTVSQGHALSHACLSCGSDGHCGSRPCWRRAAWRVVGRHGAARRSWSCRCRASRSIRATIITDEHAGRARLHCAHRGARRRSSRTREALVGKVARRTLLPGQPIPVSAIRDRRSRDAGQDGAWSVFEHGGLTITTNALALQNGGLGDVVSLRNLDSGTVIRGTVAPDGSIRLDAP